MSDGNGTAERLRQLERRLDQSESDRRDIWRAQGANQQTLAVQATQMDALREDISSLVVEMRWVRRGMWAAAGTFALFMVALAGLVLNGAP